MSTVALVVVVALVCFYLGFFVGCLMAANKRKPPARPKVVR